MNITINEEGGLVRTYAIWQEKLDPNRLTLTLLNECVRLGLLTDEQVRERQNQLDRMVQDRLYTYTRGMSNSIPAEAAIEISEDLCQAMDAALYARGSISPMVEALLHTPLPMLYEEGRALLEKQEKAEEERTDELLRECDLIQKKAEAERDSYQSNPRMEDGDFRDLVAELFDCGDNTKAKVQILREELIGLDDMVDLMESGCLFEEDFYSVFEMLDLPELAMLVNTFKQEHPDLPLNEDKIDEEVFGTLPVWQQQLLPFLDTMPTSTISELLRLARSLRRK